MQMNEQPIEKKVRGGTGEALDVHSIFYTIQGEGPFGGSPAVFVRLAGCNLQCPFCDTEYTEGRFNAGIGGILGRIEHVAPPGWRGLIVITGGEPFRQKIGPLLLALIKAGHFVQIETNGTLPPSQTPDNEVVYQTDIGRRRGAYIVCSPKSGKVNAKLAREACCFKYVMDADSVHSDGLPIEALGHTANPHIARPPEWWDRPIYLQPADHQDPVANARNIAAVVSSAMTHGYTIQLQIHKLLGME